VSLFVKICGVRTVEAVEAAVSAGADAIGFNFFPPSPRYLAPEQAARLAGAAPRRILRVAVMLRPVQKEWEQVLAEFKPDCLQADANNLARLSLPAGLRTLPVYRDHEQFQPESVPAATRCLFEGARSGAGQRPDWERAARLARRNEIVLAGGLDPANIAEAVRQVRPWGVDVASGVESAPGIKDAAAMSEFVRMARQRDMQR